jgi:hypothetical protein
MVSEDDKMFQLKVWRSIVFVSVGRGLALAASPSEIGAEPGSVSVKDGTKLTHRHTQT